MKRISQQNLRAGRPPTKPGIRSPMLPKVCTKVKKIMFIHASRGRPQIGTHAAGIVKLMTSGLPFTYYFSLDTDDPTLDDYKREIDKLGFVTDVFINDNRGCVDATNKAAEAHQDEDLIFNNGDDVGVRPRGWDALILEFIRKHVPVEEYLIHFPNAAHNANNCAIFQMLSGPLYRKLGYVFYPEYISMSADVDLWDTCNKLKVIYNYKTPPNPPIFYHNHPGLGGSLSWDATYERTNRPICYEIGGQIYNRRKLEGFPIK